MLIESTYYVDAAKTSKLLANWIRKKGWYADPKMGPNTEDVLMIPAAIAAGIGQLGKHGSLINKKLGSNFRLSMVLTDLPINVDAPESFGSEEFCENCQICVNACPPDAISNAKQLVRGDKKWYVDFDKCIPYFVDNLVCGICLAVCPWSRPGIGEKLLKKMASRISSC
jgi:epoxyqueuosine reductase